MFSYAMLESPFPFTDYLATVRLRDLDRAQIRQLATCRWIEEHTNVV